MFPHDRPHRPVVAVVLLAVVLTVVGTVGEAMVAPAPTAAADPGIQARRPRPTALSHEVYGYLPYWDLHAGTARRIDYRLVSTIAIFAVPIGPSGRLVRSSPGYRAYVGRAARAVTNAAHGQGVRVVPTFQLFDGPGAPRTRAFLHSRVAQARFIREAVTLIRRRGADGANLRLRADARVARPGLCRLRGDLPDGGPSRHPGRSARRRDVRIDIRRHDPSTRSGGRPAVRHGLRLPPARLDGPRQRRTDPRAARPTSPATSPGMWRCWVRTGSSSDCPTTATRGRSCADRVVVRVRTDVARRGGVHGVTYAAALRFLAAHPTTRVHRDGAGGLWFRWYDTAHRTDPPGELRGPGRRPGEGRPGDRPGARGRRDLDARRRPGLRRDGRRAAGQVRPTDPPPRRSIRSGPSPDAPAPVSGSTR